MYQKGRVQQSNLQKATTQVDKFLQHHSIHSDSFDVNVAKKSFGGLYRTYPLHLAAKERDWHMVRLLLHFGADPFSGTAVEALLLTAWGHSHELIDKSSDDQEMYKNSNCNIGLRLEVELVFQLCHWMSGFIKLGNACSSTEP